MLRFGIVTFVLNVVVWKFPMRNVPAPVNVAGAFTCPFAFVVTATEPR